MNFLRETVRHRAAGIIMWSPLLPCLRGEEVLIAVRGGPGSPVIEHFEIQYAPTHPVVDVFRHLYKLTTSCGHSISENGEL
jgi:hypothetical protein